MRLVDSSTAFFELLALSWAVNRAWWNLADSFGSLKLPYLYADQTTKAVRYEYDRTLPLYNQELFRKATREFSSHFRILTSVSLILDLPRFPDKLTACCSNELWETFDWSWATFASKPNVRIRASGMSSLSKSRGQHIPPDVQVDSDPPPRPCTKQMSTAGSLGVFKTVTPTSSDCAAAILLSRIELRGIGDGRVLPVKS